MFYSLGNSLEGKTIGIVGLGGIGKTIAKCLKPFSIERVIYYSRTRRPEAENDIGLDYGSFDDVVSNQSLNVHIQIGDINSDGCFAPLDPSS